MRHPLKVVQQLVATAPNRILWAFAIIGAIAAGCAASISIDTSIDRMLVQDDPDRELNRQMKHEFSNEEFVVVAFDLGHPVDAEDLRRLASLSEQIASITGIEEVVDLSNVEDVRDRDDFLDASPLVDLATLDDDLPSIRQRLIDHRLYSMNFVSDDLTVLSMVLILEPDLIGEQKHEATAIALEMIEGGVPDWAPRIAGYSVLEYEGGLLMRRDLAVLCGVSLLLVMAVMYATTRSLSSIWLLAALVAWVEVVTAAWFPLTGTPISTTSALVPAIAMALSSTYAIYLIWLLPESAGRPDPGAAVLSVIARPATLSALSTGIAFLSLRTIDMPAVSEIGTALAVVIGAAWLGTLLLLPAMVQRFRWTVEPQRMERLRSWGSLGVRFARRPWIPILVAAVLALATLPGIARLEIDVDPTQFLRADSPRREAQDFIREHLAGSVLLNVVIRTGVPDGALEPAVLGFASDVIAYLEAKPSVDRTLSLLDYFWLIDAALQPDKTPTALPRSRALSQQYLLLYDAGGDPDDLRHYLNADRSALNVLVRINDRAVSLLLETAAEVRELAVAAPAEIQEVRILGSQYLWSKAANQITEGIVQGLAIALIGIVLAMALALRSLKLALLGIVPNLVPILVCAGALGLLGLPLSISTSIVGCLALGLAVDDTAHVLGHLRPDRSLAAVYRTVAAPIIVTTISLTLGFAALMLSIIQPVAILGAATALTLLVALLFDLLVLPSLLALAGYRVD